VILKLCNIEPLKVHARSRLYSVWSIYINMSRSVWSKGILPCKYFIIVNFR